MATGTTAAARALKERQKHRTLPTVEDPQVEGESLARALQGIQEHLRMYEGDSGAPKERFVTLAELENTGLIKSDVKGRFAYISQILEKDVSQLSGSTLNPTQTDSATTDTSRTSMTPDVGSVSSGSVAPTLKLNDSQDVDVRNPAKNEFLFYNGNLFTNFPLFKKDNIWFGQQRLEKPLVFREAATGPEALEGLGYLWAKDDDPNILFYTDDTGAIVAIDPSYSPVNIQNGDYTLVLADRGKTVQKESGGSGETFTIPANSSVPYKIGTLIGISNNGGGTLTIAITSDTLTGTDGVTGSRTLGDNDEAMIRKMTATTWKYVASDL